MRPLPPLLFALGLLATPVQANPNLFATLDGDGNGVLSRDEILDLRREMFARIDADRNGLITAAEIEAARTAHAKGQALRTNKRIWRQDANKDGQLSLAEYTAKTQGFDMADRNDDGVLSPQEFDRVARFLNRNAQ